MARPAKNESDKLTKRVGFRVTENAYNAYMLKLQGGITPSEWFRDAVMNDQTEIIVRNIQSDDAKAVLIALSHIGNNINQLARATNTALISGMLGDVLASKILAHLSLIKDEVKKVVENAD